MSLELTGVHGLLKRHKLFTHKCFIMPIMKVSVLEILKWIMYLLEMEIKILLCCPVWEMDCLR